MPIETRIEMELDNLLNIGTGESGSHATLSALAMFG